MKTDKELKTLATEIYQNQIFWTPDPKEIEMSFPIFFLMSPEQMPKDIGSVYEYYREAGPRSINGLPMFFSARILTVEETKTLIQYLKEYEEMMAAWSK